MDSKRFLLKYKKVMIWAGSIIGASALQFLVLQQIDSFLKPPAFERANAQTVTAGDALSQTVQIPKGVTHYVFTPNHKAVAYITSPPNSHEEALVIKDAKGILYQETIKGNIYMEWLGQSNTLVYMVERNNGQEMYLFQAQHKEPQLIYNWPGVDRKVMKIFFSPYLEFFYVEMRDGQNIELYKYTFSTGLNPLPVQDIKISQLSYDDKKDIVYITDQNHEKWVYKDGALYDKNGQIYATQNIIPNSHKKTANQTQLKNEAAKQVQREARSK
ncbi:hypothetical protein PP175_03295 [Aneurinibacillus sp. Ricciae_BoGa-3]|uniref:hypothetical protein n=1 Tax=Aneurinibacillus sp. Ricciae_BoGa-3 TaxID=3022697 RepID=UPI002341E1A4|nr:hypothetical protein [Aneurinibacillus sp. Ricciae_BoGa-3]WCK55034.1 hypothetical protein PP175_03295 [Aneurinibacillus sp. Ricciae_BoGa-3]